MSARYRSSKQQHAEKSGEPLKPALSMDTAPEPSSKSRISSKSSTQQHAKRSDETQGNVISSYNSYMGGVD